VREQAREQREILQDQRARLRQQRELKQDALRYLMQFQELKAVRNCCVNPIQDLILTVPFQLLHRAVDLIFKRLAGRCSLAILMPRAMKLRYCPSCPPTCTLPS
jgi:hypothetical protein